MKYIITILIIFSLSLSLKAQDIQYDTCSALMQHQGEWRYANGNDTIRFFLKYHRGYYATEPKFVIDALWGNLEFKHGNTIVFSDYANISLSIPFQMDTFGLDRQTISIRYTRKDATHHKLTGTLLYPMNGLQEYHIEAILNNTGTQMTWRQKYSTTVRENADIHIPRNPPTGLDKMPDEFVLIKQ